MIDFLINWGYWGMFVSAFLAGSYTLEEIHDVALQAEHHALSLWVAHTAVVLNHHWLALYVNQAEEDEALVVDVLLGKTLNGRTDDALIHLLHPLLGSEWYRGNTTHTAGVQTGIVLADALVILSLWQNLVVLVEIVCTHDSPSLSFLYSSLEGWEIDFMEGTVAHDDVYLMTVFLLVIEAVMLYAG